MPSFDVVSEIDIHELTNAVDQANRELSQRFDFKDTGAKYDLKSKEFIIQLQAQVDFQRVHHRPKFLQIQQVGYRRTPSWP